MDETTTADETRQPTAEKLQEATSPSVPTAEERAARERAAKEARLAELDAQDAALEVERERLRLELAADPSGRHQILMMLSLGRCRSH